MILFTSLYICRSSFIHICNDPSGYGYIKENAILPTAIEHYVYMREYIYIYTYITNRLHSDPATSQERVE